MKVVHLNTSTNGGAATSAIRLHRGLITAGVQSDILFQKGRVSGIPNGHSWKPKSSSIYNRIAQRMGWVKTPEAIKNKIEASLSQYYEICSIPFSTVDVWEHPLVQQADIIHLHWVAGFLDWPTFFPKARKPIVWTFHDINPLLGIFHYKEDRNGNWGKVKDTEDRYIGIKKEYLKYVDNLTIAAPSLWMHGEVKDSFFNKFDCLNIPYGIDTELFKPHDKEKLKSILGFPEDKPTVLFISANLDNRRKGYGLLQDALKNIDKKKIHMVAVGNGTPTSGVSQIPVITDERYMSLVLAASDLFVLPSREDNLPNTVLESMACGTPVVAFDIGGVSDMIKHNENGLLVNPFNTKELAEKIELLAFDKTMNRRFSTNCRRHIEENFSMQLQAGRYIDLYNKVVAG